MSRPLIPSAALLWGLHLAILNPVIALLLVALYDATAAEVGWVIAADRRWPWSCWEVRRVSRRPHCSRI